MAQTSNCSCNSAPCGCASSTGEGCVSDLCTPRPRFFDGQLIASDDLNAAAEYARSRDLLLGRFVGGWGVYGGLRVDAAPGVESANLQSSDQPLPNPQILAGTTVQISPGVAIDALGRQLVLCSPVVLDLAQLASEAAAVTPRTDSLCEWIGVGCDTVQNPFPLTATEYVLVAEHTSHPSRPVPRFAGSGACDPSPTCDFSRYQEGVRFSLRPLPSEEYSFTGCDGVMGLPLGSPPEPGSDEHLHQRWFHQTIDAVTARLTNACCDRPFVVLARVLFTSSPGPLASGLPTVGVYTLLDDAHPIRRTTPPASLSWLVTVMTLSGIAQDAAPAAIAKWSPSSNQARRCVVEHNGVGLFEVLFTGKMNGPSSRATHVTVHQTELGMNGPSWAVQVDDSQHSSVKLSFLKDGTPADPPSFAFTVECFKAEGGE